MASQTYTTEAAAMRAAARIHTRQACTVWLLHEPHNVDAGWTVTTDPPRHQTVAAVYLDPKIGRKG